MIIKEAPYYGKRFIGDKSTKLVHDLEHGNCDIDEKNVITFDNLTEAHKAGFTNHTCLKPGFFRNNIINHVNYKPSSIRTNIAKSKDSIPNKAINNSNINTK